MEQIQELKDEQFRPVTGFGNYLISSHGRCIEVTGIGISLVLEPVNNIIKLTKDGETYQEQIPYLVAEHFIETKPEGFEDLEVTHLDGNPANNHVTNLRYVEVMDFE